jgi:hypothetical protein
MLYFLWQDNNAVLGLTAAYYFKNNTVKRLKNDLLLHLLMLELYGPFLEMKLRNGSIFPGLLMITIIT